MHHIKPKHIYISAGEASGDLLGAGLAHALLKKNPLLKLTGMGGTRMARAGVDIKFDANQLSVVGLFEVLTHLPVILKTISQIKQYLKKERPDAVVFIDFPDTHLRLAKTAKKLGIPVIYYVSPQIWAWRAGRINTIKKTIDHMAVLFPFEEAIYQKANIPVTFVGHHLKDTVKPSMSAELAYRYFNLDPKRKVIALLPGSRTGEIKRHLSLLIKSATEIRQTIPSAQFVLPIAPHLKEAEIKSQLPDFIQPSSHHLYDLLQITDAAAVVSGTVTLEVALMETPLCILYRLNTLTYWLAKALAKVSQIGLCNIIAGKPIAKELIQQNATPQLIATEIKQLLSDTAYRNKQKAALEHIKYSLGDGKSSELIAHIVLNQLKIASCAENIHH